jgi:hypothetical protein
VIAEAVEAARVLVCQWCRLPVVRPVWWDGRPQCPDVFRCEQRRTAGGVS